MSLYIHIPYCEAKCHYCDFNSYAGREREFESFVDALVRDLESASFAGPLSTVFVGGGTPSVLPAHLAARVLRTARRRSGFAPDAEVTSEANPGSLDEAFLEAMLAEGLTRLSLGVQSLDDAELARLGRVHTREMALDAVRMARRMGVPSLSVDLIYGVPGQTLEGWLRTLEEALALGLDHVSLYGLIIEEGTAFGKQHAEGRLRVPDDDAQAQMYHVTTERLAAAGFEHYEISNYARPGHRCRHNHVYWDNGDYLGVGPGAVSYLDGWRWTRVRRPSEYIRRVQEGRSLVEEGERVSAGVRLAETLMLGLRLLEGLDVALVAARFGLEERSLLDLLCALGEDFLAAGILVREGTRLRLTEAGIEVSNGVMERFLDVPGYLTKGGPDANLFSGATGPLKDLSASLGPQGTSEVCGRA